MADKRYPDIDGRPARPAVFRCENNFQNGIDRLSDIAILRPSQQTRRARVSPHTERPESNHACFSAENFFEKSDK